LQANIFYVGTSNPKKLQYQYLQDAARVAGRFDLRKLVTTKETREKMHIKYIFAGKKHIHLFRKKKWYRGCMFPLKLYSFLTSLYMPDAVQNGHLVLTEFMTDQYTREKSKPFFR